MKGPRLGAIDHGIQEDDPLQELFRQFVDQDTGPPAQAWDGSLYSQAQADRYELEAFSLDLLQGTRLAAKDSHSGQSRDPLQPVPPDPEALSWDGLKAKPSSSANSSIPLDFFSAQQAISAFSPLAEWQETQAQLEPPASVEAGATSAALTASARPPEGALSAATSDPLLAAGSGIPQAASHAQSRRGPPRTGDMLLPPDWVPTVPLSSSTAGRPAQPAFSRNPEQDGPSQGIRTPAQHRPVSANLRGAKLPVEPPARRSAVCLPLPQFPPAMGPPACQAHFPWLAVEQSDPAGYMRLFDQQAEGQQPLLSGQIQPQPHPLDPHPMHDLNKRRRIISGQHPHNQQSVVMPVSEPGTSICQQAPMKPPPDGRGNTAHGQMMPRRQQVTTSKTPPVGYSEDAGELEKTVHELQRELQLSRAREEKAEELVSSLQLVFMNNLEISPRARRAVHNLTSAYTDLFEVPETDRSVAQADNFPWQHGWAGNDGQPSIAQGVWHAIICCNGEAEMTFESSLPGMEGSPVNVQHLMHDPPHIWMQRMQRYGQHIAVFLDHAGGDVTSPAAQRAAQLGMEFAALIIAKSGRIPRQYHMGQTIWCSPEWGHLTRRQRHFAAIAAECSFSRAQKAKAISKRRMYYLELGRLVRHREQLLGKLEGVALMLHEAEGGQMEMLLVRPSKAAKLAVQIVQELKQTMDYQRFLMRTFSYEVLLEVMTPLQHAILVGRSAPYVMDIMATVEAVARESPQFQSAGQLLSCK